MTVTRESRVTPGVTYPHLSRVSHRTPSRPVPTRPMSLVSSVPLVAGSKSNLNFPSGPELVLGR